MRAFSRRLASLLIVSWREDGLSLEEWRRHQDILFQLRMEVGVTFEPLALFNDLCTKTVKPMHDFYWKGTKMAGQRKAKKTIEFEELYA